MGWQDGQPVDNSLQAGGMTATGRLLAPRWQQAQDDAEFDRMTNKALIEQQLGDSLFNPELGMPASMDRFWAKQTGSPQGQEKYLQEQGYDAKMVELPNGQTVVYRPEGEEAYRPVDEPSFSAADIFSDAGALMNLENAVGTGASFLPGGLLARLGWTTLGTGGGNVLDQMMREEKGYQDEFNPVETAVSAGSSATGELGGALFGKMLGGHRGVFEPRAPEKEAMRIAAETDGLEGLSMGQIGPIAQLLENRLARTSTVIPEYRQKQKESLQAVLRQTQGDLQKEAATLDDAALMDIGDEMQRGILERFAVAEKGQGGINIAKGGEELQKLRDAYQTMQDEYFGRQYPKLWGSRPEGTYFDIGDIKALAGDILAGKEIPLENGETGLLEKPISSNFRDQLQKMVGQPAVEGGAEAVPGYADQLDDPELLKELAGLFYDTAQPDPKTGKRTVEGNLAQQILSGINDARYNPQGTDLAEGWGKKWSDLSGEYKRYRDVLDLGAMKDMETSENPYALMSKFIEPGDPYRVATVQKIFEETGNPGGFKALKEAFKDKLVSQPENINRILDGYKAEQITLRKFMTPDEEKTFRIIGNMSERVKSAPVTKLLKKTGDAAETALGLLEQSDNAAFDEYMRTLSKLNPGREKAVKKAMLSGMLDKILTKHEFMRDGRPDFDLNGFANEINDMMKTGHLKKVANPGELEALKNFMHYASVIGKTQRSDVGAAIGGSSDVKKTFDTLMMVEGGGGSAISNLISLGIDRSLVPNFMVNSKAQKYIYGHGRTVRPRLEKFTKNVARTLGLLGDDISQMTDLKYDPEQKVPPGEAKKILEKE